MYIYFADAVWGIFRIRRKKIQQCQGIKNGNLKTILTKQGFPELLLGRLPNYRQRTDLVKNMGELFNPRIIPISRPIFSMPVASET